MAFVGIPSYIANFWLHVLISFFDYIFWLHFLITFFAYIFSLYFLIKLFDYIFWFHFLITFFITFFDHKTSPNQSSPSDSRLRIPLRYNHSHYKSGPLIVPLGADPNLPLPFFLLMQKNRVSKKRGGGGLGSPTIGTISIATSARWNLVLSEYQKTWLHLIFINTLRSWLYPHLVIIFNGYTS